MEHIGIRFKSGYMIVALDPESKKVNISANIKDTAVTGSATLKPVKATKESK